VSVLVALRFKPADIFEALQQHGSPRTGSHQTKHRFRTGTLTILSNASKGELFIVSPEELRILQPPKRLR
jgi:hypothetical protein